MSVAHSDPPQGSRGRGRSVSSRIAGSGAGTEPVPWDTAPPRHGLSRSVLKRHSFKGDPRQKTADETGSNQTQTEWKNGTGTPFQQVKTHANREPIHKKTWEMEGRAPRRRVWGREGKAFLRKHFPSLPQNPRRGAHPSISKDFYTYRILVHSLFWIIAKLTCPIDRRATFCRDDALCGIDPATCR